MMIKHNSNRYGPVLITDGERAGKWVYGGTNQYTGAFSIGYCTQCTGHNSKEEAIEHYQQYLIEHTQYWHQKQCRACRICGQWSTGMAELSGIAGLFPLCSEHRNRKGVEQIVKQLIGHTTSS